MISARLRLVLFAWLQLAVVAAATRADSILDQLPSDAVGFALVNNLEAANAKIERVSKIFQDAVPMPIPAPLPVIKAATGLGAGLNERGDALLAILPGDEGLQNSRPLLLVAVADYAQFAASVNGDASGEICRVTISGEEVLVGKRGDYAVLMNVEHRERLDAFLAAEPAPLADLQPLRPWLAKLDVAVALTPSGLDMLSGHGKAGVADQRVALEGSAGVQPLQQVLRMYEETLGFVGAELDAFAVGLAIDDNANVKLLSQAVLSKGGKLANIAIRPASEARPLAGFPDEPYVIAAAGSLPAEHADAIATIMRNIAKANPESYGFEDLTAEEWEEFKESWQAYLAGIESMSMVMYLGEEGDPLASNGFTTFIVNDADAYLQSYVDSMKKWNQLLSRTTLDIDLKYETSDVEIAGRKGVLTAIDVAAAADDPNVPMIRFMTDAMFGEDGKMETYLVPASDTTVLMGLADKKRFAEILEAVAKGETGLADSPQMQTTVKLLDRDASWMGVVSPKGLVTWAVRFYEKMLGGSLNFPEYPDSPPMGFTFSLSGELVGAEIIWPVEALEGFAAYLKTLQDSF